MGRDDGRGEDGAALVEFALVAVVLLTLVVGILSYGMILGLQQSVTHTAAAATRAAVVTPEAEIATRVDEVVAQQLGWLGGRQASVTAVPSVGACPGASAARCVTVTVSLPYGAGGEPFVPSVLGLPIPDTISSAATLELEDLG